MSALGGVFLVVAVACSACAGRAVTGDTESGLGDRGTGGSGTLIGRALRGPASPVGGVPDAGTPTPVAGLRIRISRSEGGRSETVSTDDKGEFRKVLPAGSHRVELAEKLKTGFTKDLPTVVNIGRGQETRLEIRIDSGIR